MVLTTYLYHLCENGDQIDNLGRESMTLLATRYDSDDESVEGDTLYKVLYLDSMSFSA